MTLVEPALHEWTVQRLSAASSFSPIKPAPPHTVQPTIAYKFGLERRERRVRGRTAGEFVGVFSRGYQHLAGMQNRRQHLIGFVPATKLSLSLALPFMSSIDRWCDNAVTEQCTALSNSLM
jgi:hypothetical protein